MTKKQSVEILFISRANLVLGCVRGNWVVNRHHPNVCLSRNHLDQMSGRAQLFASDYL